MNTSKCESSTLTNRIDTLEYKLAFQEDTIQQLNQALSQQQLLISQMQEHIQLMANKVKTLNVSQLADATEETPPPHY